MKQSAKASQWMSIKELSGLSGGGFLFPSATEPWDALDMGDEPSADAEDDEEQEDGEVPVASDAVAEG